MDATTLVPLDPLDPPQTYGSEGRSRTPRGTRAVMGRPTRLQDVSGQLADMAHRLGPGAKLPTVIELRDQMGASISTVHAALGELEARGVIVRRHGVGIFVAEALHRKNIVLLCDHSFFGVPGLSPFWEILVSRARARASAAVNEVSFEMHIAHALIGDDAAFENGLALSEGLAAQIVSGKIDGAFTVGVHQKVADWIQRQGVCVVGFAGTGPYGVEIDHAEGVRQAVRALAAQDCRCLALWSPVTPFRPTKWEDETPVQAAFREELAACGLPFLPGLVRDNRHLTPRHGAITEASHQQQGYHTAQAVFGPDSGSDEQKPDGIVSTDDMMTRGALTALDRMGVRAGTDVRIATHANVGSQALLGYEEDLTLIEVDPAQVVAAMFTHLETLMDGDTPPRKTVIVSPRLRRTATAAGRIVRLQNSIVNPLHREMAQRPDTPAIKEGMS